MRTEFQEESHVSFIILILWNNRFSPFRYFTSGNIRWSQNRIIHKGDYLQRHKLQIFANCSCDSESNYFTQLLPPTRRNREKWPQLTLFDLNLVDFVRDAKLGKSFRDWSSGTSRIGQKNTKKFKSNLINRFSREKRTRTQAYKVINWSTNQKSRSKRMKHSNDLLKL